MISASIKKSLSYLHPKTAFFLREFHGSLSLSLQLCHVSKESDQPVDSPTSTEFLLGKNPEISRSILLFLTENGFSETQSKKLMKSRKQLLSADLENSVKPKFQIFQDWGFSDSDIVEIITKEPTILCHSVSNKIIPSLLILRDLLGSNEDVIRAVKKCGWFLIADMEKRMWPNIEFLKSSGIPMKHVRSILLTKYPSYLFLKSDTVRERVKKLNALGMDPSSKMFVYAFRVLSSLANEVLELKVETFRELGFSESDILTIFRKAPQVFSVSVTKIKRMVEVIFATNRYNVSSTVANPVSLCCSLDKRIIPRLQVLETLYKKNLINEWPALGPVYAFSDVRFYQRYTSLLSK